MRLYKRAREFFSRIHQTLGHRGSVLVWLAALTFLSGVYYVTHASLIPPTGILVWDDIPNMIQGWIWIVVSLVAASFATAPYRTDKDKYGYVALVVPSMFRTGLAAWTWFLGLVTSNRVGNTDLWMVTLISAFTVVVILQVASWPDTKE